MKKIAIVIMCMLLLFTAAGCQNNDNEQISSSETIVEGSVAADKVAADTAADKAAADKAVSDKAVADKTAADKAVADKAAADKAAADKAAADKAVAEEEAKLKCDFSLSKSASIAGSQYQVTFSLTASGSGGSGDGYTYKFEIIQNGSVTETFDFSPNNAISNTISGNGTFEIQMTVKDGNGDIKTINCNMLEQSALY